MDPGEGGTSPWTSVLPSRPVSPLGTEVAGPPRLATLADQREQLRFVLGAASAMTYDLDLATGCLTISDNFESLIGLDPGSFPRTRDGFMALIHPDDRDRAHPSTRVPRPDGDFEHEFRMLLPGGEVRWIHSLGRWVLDDRGRAVGIRAVGLDVTGRHRSEEAARSSEEVGRVAAANSPDAVVGTDQHGRITGWNGAAEHLFGWSGAEAYGRTMGQMIVPERHREAYADAVARVRDHAEGPQARSKLIEMVAVHRDGREIPVQIAITAVQMDGGTYLNAFIRDVTARSELEARLRQQALLDPLTGVANRALFLDRLGRAVSRRNRRPGSLAMLFVDLDRFKVVNDALGHAAGDEVLIAVAARISGALRGTDTVGRYGGDEFVVLCEDLVTPGHATALAERITLAISQPIRFVDRSVVVTASIGVAALGSIGGNADDLLHDADAAMYQAKQLGGNRHLLVDADAMMPRRGLARLDIETDLRTADLPLGAAPGLPADDRPHHRAGDRRRGPAALGPPGERRDRPPRVHPPRRGDGPDRPDRRLGPDRGVPSAECLAGGARAAGPGQPVRQPLGPATGRGPHGGPGRRSPGPLPARAGQPLPRDHRERVDARRRRHASTAWQRSGTSASGSASTTSAPGTRRSCTSSGSRSTS